MLLWAEISDAVQVVATVCSMLTTVLMAYIGYLTLHLKQQQERAAVKVELVAVVAERAANRVAEVKTVLHEVTVEQNEKLDSIAASVHEVHQATNGLKAELVEEVRTSSFARGVKSEVDKHPHAPGSEP